MEKFSLNINPTAHLTTKSSAEHQAEPKTSTTRRDDCKITSSLQQRVTHHRKVQDISRKPVRPDVTVTQ